MDQQQSTNETSTGFIEFLAWLEINQKRIAIGIVLAVLVGFLVWLVGYMKERKEAAASGALLALKVPAGSPPEVTIPADEYLKVSQQYSGTRAAARAQFLAATALFTAGKYSEAQAQFSTFLSNHGATPWAASAAYGIGTSLEAQKKLDEALAQYQKVWTQYPRDAVANDAKLAAARIYEAKNQPEQAFRLIDELARPTGTTAADPQFITKREQLLKKHPHLRPALNTTNTAAAALPIPTSPAPQPTVVPAPAK